MMNRALRNTTNVNYQRLPEKQLGRVTKKSALAEQKGPVTRRGALADHRNILPSKALKQEISKNGDAKKEYNVGVHARKPEKVKEEAPVAVVEREPEVKNKSFTESRFDDVVLYCCEYREDVENYIFVLEKGYAVRQGFLEGSEVTPRMRSILVDWLIQVHLRFHLLPETLFLAFNILDRYLSKGVVDRNTLQLVGVSSLSAASKYEEIFPPDVVDFQYITENSVTKADIIKMEYQVLAALDSNLGRPTVIQFLRRLSTFFTPRIHILAKYISENMIVDYETCYLNPSLIATVSIYVAAAMTNTPFPDSIYTEARVKKEDVVSVVPRAAKWVLEAQRSQKLVGVREKYASLRNGRVSFLDQSQIDVLHYLGGCNVAHPASQSQLQC